MQITISGQQIELTDALHKYVSEKIGRIQKHFDNVTHTNVVLRVEKMRHRAEATLHVKGAQFHAVASGEDMYAAIDSLSDKINRQVIKYKEKTSDHHQSDGAQRKHGAM